MMKRLLGQGAPNSKAVRAGHANIHHHLDYIGYLTERRIWLAGDTFSLADITAAAHLSTIDYLGDVPWKEHEEAKNWYARVKSRPSFRVLLEDNVPGAPPQRHYANLDPRLARARQAQPASGYWPQDQGGPTPVATLRRLS